MGAIADAVFWATFRSVHALAWLGSGLFSALWGAWDAVSAVKHKGAELERIRDDAKDLPKLPLHLAVVLAERDVSCLCLAELAAWAFAVGIRCLSIYDPEGIEAHLIILCTLKKLCCL